MKMLVKRSTPTALPFALSDVKAHLRVLHDEEDDAIQIMAEAAAWELESFAQLALLTQDISVSILYPASAAWLTLPVGPVSEDNPPTVTIDGTAFLGFDFIGGNRPCIVWEPEFFDLIPARMEITYQAGFGASAQDVPRDLLEAIMDQAALHYDSRGGFYGKAPVRSPHMARIAARYRGVQA